MNKEMVISSNGHETRVAILEDDQVTEVFIERERQRGAVGNIYKGRVSKVLPGMQSAFVDVALERDAFLYVTDVIDTIEEFERLESGEEEEDSSSLSASVEQGTPASLENGGEEPGAAPAPAANGQTEGDDGERLRPARGGSPEPAWSAERGTPARGGGAPRAEREAGKRAEGAPPSARKSERDRGPQPKIEDLLKEGQEILVQVVKEPLGTKGARITSHVSMPGRFLVFLPTVDHIGVSRKIESRDERHRLRSIVREFKEERGFGGGVIIRTAAGGRSKEDIVGDLEYFYQVWTDIRQKVETVRAPATVFREQGLVTKLLRDLLTSEFTAIRIDNEQEHRRTLEFVSRIMPSMAPRVKLYSKDFPIFEEYGVQAEIDKALRSKVWLKSGGYIVVNQTEALVAIDVNTGRYVGKRTGRLEDTIVKTNLEATREIVRQIRLRDLGGIIVLDFIDMEERKNRQRVFQAMEQELRKDRAPSKSLQVADVGLIIITRKRVKQSLERFLTEPCPYCSGTGAIKSSATICYEILDEMKKVRADLDGHGLVLRVNPDIARALKEEERAVLKELEESLGKKITIKPDAHLHHEQFDVMAI